MVWNSHLFQNFQQFVVIHTVKDFGIVNKEELDVFVELSFFFGDPTDVGNLISGSPAFSKSNLNIWKFMVHILLKPGLENFEHYFTSVVKRLSISNFISFDLFMSLTYFCILGFETNMQRIQSIKYPCTSW